MPGLAIDLLGRPRAVQEGVELPPPRGHKAWALLTYLLLSDAAPTRSQLVTLLFAEADDPHGALRWNLSALRRLLPGAEIGGDPVRVELPPGTTVNAQGEQELLEGMAFRGCPAFEIWLDAERRHAAAAVEADLHERALARLAAGDAAGAADLAARLVAVNPYDENFQALLVRSLAAAGQGIAAARQVARCGELFRRELGIEPSPALAAAAQTRPAAPVAGPAGARAQLEAGEAAIAAGALDAGLQCLRGAVAAAAAAGEDGLHAQALVALGYALVHAARGRDEEAATALHQGLALAERAGVPGTGAAACRELGYVEFLQGRYEHAESWVQRGVALAGDDPRERGRIACVHGSVLTDTAVYGEAIARLEEALALNRQVTDVRQTAYTLSMLGRAQLLRGELDLAAATLDESLGTAQQAGWTAFTPWPGSLRAEVDLETGDLDAARDRYEHAFALGCQIGDPCWEGMSARGLGRLAALRGDVGEGVEWLTQARTRCMRLPDAYRWVEAYTLDALCAVAVEHGLPGAARWAEELSTLATRTGMRDLAIRALLHRGDDSALTAARLAAATIDSPALAELVGRATPAAA